MASNPSLLPEIGPDGLPREAPVIAYTEKIIEEEQLQLKKYIEENYSKIRDVERELSNLTMEMKLTAGPKKAALEHMRKKIEASTERIHAAKLKEEQARKAWEAASKVVRAEEAMKQKLCEDLNNLVQESSNSQFSRLEELKRRLEALNPSRASTNLPNPQDEQPVVSSKSAYAADASSIPSTTKPSVVSDNVANQENGGKVPRENGQSQPTYLYGEGQGRKKAIQLKVKGMGAVPKGRSPSADWTGAGFDVDGRT